MENNNFKEIVFNRKSIKAFDENVKISKEEMLEMINEAVTAPSSINMQPWRFVVVDSEEGKNILRPLVKFNTKQNDTSAAMILIFGDMKCYEKGDEIYSKAVEKNFITKEVKNEMMNLFIPFYENASKEKMNDIVKIDSSLAAMQLMLIARSHGYDTNPIGGFDQENIAETFGLDSERYVPVMIIAIGKADPKTYGSIKIGDKEIETFGKVRLEAKDITEFK